MIRIALIINVFKAVFLSIIFFSRYLPILRLPSRNIVEFDTSIFENKNANFSKC